MSAPTSQSPQLAHNAKIPKRRANSCVPCRDSKSRCSGGVPCSTCQKKRQKPRCYYLNTFSKDREENELTKPAYSQRGQKETSSATAQQDINLVNETDDGESALVIVGPHDNFYGAFSLSRSVDEFKLLLSPDGQFQELIVSLQPAQVFIAELDGGENPLMPDMIRFQNSIAEVGLHDPHDQVPMSLRRVYMKYLSTRQRFDMGMVAQAWTDFSGLIRDAELIGLDQDGGSADSGIDAQELELRRHLWWLLVKLDAQLSLLLGRRPLISPFHGVLKPTVHSSRHEEKDLRQDDLRQNVLDFSQYMIEVLGDIHNDKAEAQTGPKEKRMTLESALSQLRDLQSRLPLLPQNGVADVPLWTSIAEHQLEVQLFLMVLYCQILRSASSEQTRTTSEKQTPPSKAQKIRHPRKSSSKSYYKDHYKEMLKCVRTITDIFDYIHTQLNCKSTSSWPRCFGVSCAATILGIARLRQEVDLDTDSARVKQTLEVFQKLAKHSQGSGITPMAINSLDGILKGIRQLESQPKSGTETCPAPGVCDTPAKAGDDRQVAATRERQTNKVDVDTRAFKRQTTATYDGELRQDKRPRFSTVPTGYEEAVPPNPPAWQPAQEHPYAQAMTSFNDMSGASFPESSAPNSFDQQSFPPSASNSFNANDQMEYTGVGYGPAHPENGTPIYPHYWWHPPLVYPEIHPPMALPTIPNPAFDAYYGAPATTMDQPHSLEDTLHEGQHVAMTNLGPVSPPRAETLIMNDGENVHPGGATPIVTHSSGGQDAQFYNPSAETHSLLDHPMSSPGIGDGSSHRDGVLARHAAPSRRQSAADIRQQQMNSWTIDTPTNYTEHVARGKQKDGPDRTQSPPRATLLSPINEGESLMQHDPTSRHISRKGTHSDIAATEQQMHIHSPEEHYPCSRRHSMAHATEAGVPQLSSLGERMAEQAPTGNHPAQATQQQRWPQRQPQPRANVSPYNPTGQVPYNMEMAGHTHAHAMATAYDHPHPHPHHPHPHPHHHLHNPHQHLAPHVVTTGPFQGNSGGQPWWGS